MKNKNKVIRIEERLKNVQLFLLFGFLFVVLSARFIQEMWAPTAHEASALSFLVGLGIVGTVLFLLWRLKMVITINPKGIKFKISPLHPKKFKIAWSEIERCQWVDTSTAAQWSGWGVSRLGIRERMFSLCGKKGIYIQKKDGEIIFLGSLQLLGHQERVMRLMQKKGIRIEE